MEVSISHWSLMGSLYMVLHVLLLSVSTSAEFILKADKTRHFLVEGDTLVMSCSTTGAPPGTTLEFKKTGRDVDVKLVSGGRTNVTTTTGTSPTIRVTIKGVTDADKGDYVCTTSTPGATDGYVTVEIFPKSSIPKTITKSAVFNWKSGKAEQITCQAKYIPLPKDKITEVFYRWAKGSEIKIEKAVPIFEKNETSGVQTMTSVLPFPAVSPADGGVYSCQPISLLKNGVEWKHEEKTFFTIASITPVISKEAHAKEVEAKEGESKSLDCSWNTYPLPSITWRIVIEDEDIDKEIKEDGKKYNMSAATAGAKENKVLTILNVDKEDRALYTCTMTRDNNGTAETLASMQFQLRTRSSRYLVGPIVGIVVEAIILAVVIFACDKIKDKRKRDQAGGLVASMQGGVTVSS